MKDVFAAVAGFTALAVVFMGLGTAVFAGINNVDSVSKLQSVAIDIPSSSTSEASIEQVRELSVHLPKYMGVTADATLPSPELRLRRF